MTFDSKANMSTRQDPNTQGVLKMATEYNEHTLGDEENFQQAVIYIRKKKDLKVRED
jgi:hypothetical protein